MIFNKSGLKRKLKVSSVDIQIKQSELKTLECDILNPDQLIYLEINNKHYLIKKKTGLSIDLDIHHSKVFNSVYTPNLKKSINFFIYYIASCNKGFYIHIFISGLQYTSRQIF